MTTGRPFPKGASGNPRGRPPGRVSPERAAAKAIEPHVAKLAEICVESGLAGDTQGAAAALGLFMTIKAARNRKSQANDSGS
jgi:hypothetical protein